MTIHSEGTCGSCKVTGAGGPPQTNLEQIGSRVLTESRRGSGKERTDHSFFQCKKCGSVWVELEDSGMGGHGRFWRRLTESLF